MLKGRDHQHARIVAKDILGAIAVVHIEVGHHHPLEAVLLERVGRAHRDVVEKAEPHGPPALGVMPGRPHAAEGVARLASQHQIGRVHHGSGRAQRGAQRVRVHCRVRVQVHQAPARDAGLERIEVVLGMHPQQLLAGGRRGLALHQVADQARSNELVFDRMQPVRALGMMLPHVVQQAIAMANQGGVHVWAGRRGQESSW